MIKANELRVGNLLDNGYGIVQVTSISLDIDDEYKPTIGVCKYGEHRNEIIVNEAAFGIEVKPIPLSVELMAKLGFSWNAKDKRYYIQIGNTLYLEYDTDFDFYIAPESWAGSCPWNMVKQVHQLQNLYFALTGEELILK